MADLLDRARQLLAAGPYDARPAELAAVHAAIYPDRDAVCETCRHELGRAYYAIQRWAGQQGAVSATPLSSSTMKKPVVARFKSDTTIYTPHGLGVAYSNANLTDKAARDILANDPDAAGLFDVLPPAAEAGEEEQATSTQASTEPATQPTPAASLLPEGFDYKALASAMVDELERREREATEKHLAQADDAPATDSSEADEDNTDGRPNLTASAGGAGEASTDVKTETLGNGVDVTTGSVVPEGSQDEANHDERPVRLSRMNKDQLTAAYTAELGVAPAADLNNDDLREAIANKRAAGAAQA